MAGALYDVWYDGAAFRMKTSPGVTTLATRPACTVTIRGRIWLTAGGAGVKDDVSVCGKDVADGYSWRVLY